MAPVTIDLPDSSRSAGAHTDLGEDEVVSVAVEESMESIKLENRNIAAEIAALLAEEDEEVEEDETPLAPLRRKRNKAVSGPEDSPGQRNSCFLTEIDDEDVFIENGKKEENSIVDFYLKGQMRNETTEEEFECNTTEVDLSRALDDIDDNNIKHFLASDPSPLQQEKNDDSENEIDINISLGLVNDIISELTEEAFEETRQIPDIDLNETDLKIEEVSVNEEFDSCTEIRHDIGNVNYVESIQEKRVESLVEYSEENLNNEARDSQKDECPSPNKLKSDLKVVEYSEEFNINFNLSSSQNSGQTLSEPAETTQIFPDKEAVDESNLDGGQEELNNDTDLAETSTEDIDTERKDSDLNRDKEKGISTTTTLSDLQSQQLMERSNQMEKQDILSEGYPEFILITMAIFLALIVMFN